MACCLMNPFEVYIAIGLRALKEEGLFERYILVCGDDYAQETEDGIEIVPWRQFLDELWDGKII